MLDDAILQQILERLPRLTIGVLGDLFLDRYLDIDGALTEPSLETGLDAYQVVRVRPSPGAAGTVINNLVALGAGGGGYQIQPALPQQGAKQLLFAQPTRRTPTITKPMLREQGRPARDLNR